MPNKPCAPPRDRREPVITSSKIEIAPCSRHSSMIRSKKPGCGGTRPMLPTTGSTITAAILPRSRSNSSLSAVSSLNGRLAVFATTACGTPAESGLPNVAKPLPALTKSPSEWP
jgi:hypothetical protein